jgi:hypothetical protein
MSEHQRETKFLRHVILYDDSDEHRKVEKNIAQVQHDERCVQRLAGIMALFLMLASAGIAYGAILHKNFPYDGSELVFRILCEAVLASLICLVAFAGLLMVYRWRLNRLREEGRRLVTRLLESRLGKPYTPTLPDKGTDDRDAPSRSGASGSFQPQA